MGISPICIIINCNIRINSMKHININYIIN